MLALLQRRVQSLFSRRDDSRTPMRRGMPVAPYQRPQKSVRPPLIPHEDEPEKSDGGGFFWSIGRLVFGGFRKKPAPYQYHHPNAFRNSWPMQETYMIPHEDEPPPSMDARVPTPKNSYPMIAQDMVEKNHNQNKPSRPYYSGRDGEYTQQSKKRMQHNDHYSSNPETYYERSCETNEIVFGAVQEQDGHREAVVIKAVDYTDPRYNHQNVRPRINYVGYSQGY